MGCKQLRSRQVIYVIVRSFIKDVWNTPAAQFTGVLTSVNVEISTSRSGIKLARICFTVSCVMKHTWSNTHTHTHTHTHKNVHNYIQENINKETNNKNINTNSKCYHYKKNPANSNANSVTVT